MGVTGYLEGLLPGSVLAFGVVYTRKRDVKWKGREWMSYREWLERFPFLWEVILVVMVFGIYEVARVVCRVISNGDEVAVANAELVIAFEKMIGLDLEKSVQSLFLESSYLPVFNHYYRQMHWFPFTCFLVFVFANFRDHYYFVRRWFVVANLLAFIGFAAYPCAPPRLVPGGGFVDTLRIGGQYNIGMLENPLVNPYASMPSMHFGYSLLYVLTAMMLVVGHSKCGWCMKHAALLMALLLYPSMMLLVIVTTGNHFFLDAIIGGCTVCVAYFLVSRDWSVAGGVKLANQVADDAIKALSPSHKAQVKAMAMEPQLIV